MRLFNVILVATVIGTLAFALTQRDPASSEAAQPAARAALPTAPLAQPSDALEGEVLELIDVPNYTYLRLGESGTAGTWAAVSSAKVAKGSRVRVISATKLQSFRSETLDRTFDVIYFGALEGMLENPHGKSQPSVEVPVGKIAKAAGPGSFRIAELYTQKHALAGKTVRVRGVVVKSTSGVLGKTFLHLRDGSGDEKASNHDLAVTTLATPAVGDTVTLQGSLSLDEDIGAGYRYDVLLEEAKLEPNR